MARWSRRELLAASGALAVGGFAGCAGGGDDPVATGPTAATDTGDRVLASDAPASAVAAGDSPDWESVRAQFRLRPDVHHFAAFVLAAHPAPVAEAIERHRQGLDSDTDGYLNEHGTGGAAVRGAAADYLGGAAAEIALTDSTTMGLGLLYGGLQLGPGDEVLTTEHDFYATHEALRLRAERTGTTVRRATLYDTPAQAAAGTIVERLMAEVRPETRAIALTWVHSSTGVKLPVADISAALADVNADRGENDRVLLCVDGVHGFGIESDTVDDLGCDFLVSGTHKWLFGPRGTGLVWGRSAAWDRVDTVIPTFDGTGSPGERATPGGYQTFEHRWAVEEAFAFHLGIGKDAIARRTKDQATQLKAGLSELPGLEVITPADESLSAGIVCVSSGSDGGGYLLGPLREQGFTASITPYARQYLRFGPSIVTSPEEVDALIAAMASLL